MTKVSDKYKSRPVLTDQEINDMMSKADLIMNEYFRLRAKAIVSLLKKFGKRRIEIARLKVEDLKQENRYLTVTFTLAKKHKKGLDQFIEVLKAKDPELAYKLTYPELKVRWAAWKKTEEGIIRRDERIDKKVALTDKYAQHITAYLDYLVTKYPKAVYLFPRGKAIFTNYMVIEDQHISGRQVLRIVKTLDPTTWCHLFRDGKGAEIARDIPNKLLAVFQVKATLDLENEETAYVYVKRWAAEEMKTEET